MSSSKYAAYFHISSGYATCKECKDKLSHKDGNSKGLRKHMQAKHKETWQRFEAEEQSIASKRKAEADK